MNQCHPYQTNKWNYFTLVEIHGEINVLAASKAVTRKIPYKITYKRGHQRELLIKFDDLQVKGYEKAMMTLKVDSNGLKLNFGNKAGQKGPKYEITVSGQVENQGKCLRARARWNKVKSPNIFKVEETNAVIFCCLKYFGLYFVPGDGKTIYSAQWILSLFL